MRQMFALITECVDDVVRHFSEKVSNGERINIEMKDFFRRYANDVIATCAFGIKVNSFDQPDNEFYANGKKLIDFSSLKAIIKMTITDKLPTVARIFNF